MRMMDDTINNSSSNFFVIENIIPFSKLKIGSDNQAFTFIAISDDLKKQLGANAVDGNIAPFIADKEIAFFKNLHEFKKITLLFSLNEFIDKSCRTEEPDFETVIRACLKSIKNEPNKG